MKEQKSNIKHNKGITLIALIITIVVLLILAVVTIGAIKDSKIITHAQSASDDYTIAQEKEQIQLALSEWQIQKNTSGNTQTFKDVMTSVLKENATVSGENDDGPVTVIFKKTNNEYTVTSDGNIKEIVKLSKTDLEKYIFGNDLKGRELFEFLDIDADDNMYFVDNSEITIALLAPEENDVLTTCYIKYDNKTYKFKIDAETGISISDYGLTEIEVDTENTKVGKTVSYDERIWTILYDDEINGLQMISNKVYGYNGKESLYLGCGEKNTSITDWSGLDTTTDEFKLSDLDGSGKIDGNFEQALYSYNTAIKTLNNACENVVAKNNNIEDVRCVGSNPVKKNSENATPYISENWTTETKGNGKGKSSDSNYVVDFERMVALGINRAYNSYNKLEYYWLASRNVLEETDKIEFCVRYVTGNDDHIGVAVSSDICYVPSSGKDWEMWAEKSLRPVITLKSAESLSVNTTGETDYILN